MKQSGVGKQEVANASLELMFNEIKKMQRKVSKTCNKLGRRIDQKTLCSARAFIALQTFQNFENKVTHYF